MTPEEAVKKLIAEIRADRKQRADDLRTFCAEIGDRLTEFRGDVAGLREEIIGLKFVLSDARKDLDKQAGELRMLSDFTGMTEKKAGNGHRGKR